MLEPLAARHEHGLWVASHHPEILPSSGIFRRHMIIKDVGIRDSAYYSVTDEECSTVRINLEQRLAAARP